MTRRYDRIMDRLTVTEAMRRRILASLRGEASAERTTPARPARAGRNILIAACFAMIFLCCTALLHGALTRPELPPQPERPSTGAVTALPPFTEADSSDALSKAAGFPVKELTALPFPVTETRFFLLNGGTAQIVYTGESQTLTYRKAPGTEDPSGLSGPFAAEEEQSLGGQHVTLLGDGTAFSAAIWTDGTCAFSLTAEPALPPDSWDALLAELTTP